MTGAVTVIQADREAFYALRAIECSNEPYWVLYEGKEILAGELDGTSQVQAFARHRTTSQSELVEALRHLRAFWRPGSDHDTQEVQMALVCADALLAKIEGDA